jgi:hypothetical protein
MQVRILLSPQQQELFDILKNTHGDRQPCINKRKEYTGLNLSKHTGHIQVHILIVVSKKTVCEVIGDLRRENITRCGFLASPGTTFFILLII